MKKVILIALTVALMLSLMPAAALAKPGNGKGNGADVIDVNGFHYTLNIIGKKAGWNGNGDGGSTIFVPADSEDLQFEAPDGTMLDGVKIGISLGPEYLVTDGNAFDDGKCSIELPNRKYSLWIAMRGKPSEDLYAIIKGWIYDEDTDTSIIPVGEINVTRKWRDATDELLYVDLSGYYGSAWGNVYVLDLLEGVTKGDVTVQIDEYFWQLVSNGAKLIKVRFYPTD